MTVDRNELSLQLRKLRLSRIGEILDHHMQKAADQNLTHLEFLNRLLQQLRLFELADQIDRGFDADREAGCLSMDKIAEAIRAVRREHPYK